MESHLAGVHVLVTRPEHQTQQLMSMLAEEGAQAFSFPTIEIVPSCDDIQQNQIVQNLEQVDIALFVSLNAVRHAMQFIQSMPTKVQLGVVGKGTLKELLRFGLESQAIPAKNYNSEGLLATPLLNDVKGKKIIIFRGQEGRNLLGDTLSERGAFVEYCEVYRRAIPNYDDERYITTFKHQYDISVFTSTEGLNNAFQMLQPPEQEKLKITDWLLISERMKNAAYNLGHKGEIIIAAEASDEGIMKSILEWKKTHV